MKPFQPRKGKWTILWGEAQKAQVKEKAESDEQQEKVEQIITSLSLESKLDANINPKDHALANSTMT